MGNVLAGKESTAAALRPEVEVFRVSGVHGDPELESEVALQLGDVQRYQVGATVGSIDQAWICASRRGRSSSFSVSDRSEPSSGATACRSLGARRDHARKQGQVVVDDARQNRLRRHVDHPSSRLPQEQEEEEEALLVGLGPWRPSLPPVVEGNHNDRLLVLGQPLD